MKRRTFIKQSSAAIAGGVLLPSLLVSGCRDPWSLPDLSYDGRVLIIGAGAAGLYAGSLLQSRGVEFEILEASDRYGGRLGKLTGFSNFPIDLGAQWLHGKNNLAGDLIKSSDTPITLDNGDERFWFEGELVENLPQNINIFSGSNLPDISFEEYANQNGLGEAYQYIIENIAGDQGADASHISVYYNHLEEKNWSSGNKDFKFRETYFDLIEQEIAIHIQDKIRLNTVVQRIDYTADEIVVTDMAGEVYLADKIILTVPITVLKSGDIEFIPALPTEQTTAFSKIGMDPGMKVFLKFNNRFYHENIRGGEVCAAYVDDSVGKAIDDFVLLAFVMGEQAEFLASLPDDEAVTQALLTELDEMYDGQASPSFVDAHVQNWTAHPFVRGAYSYSTVGMGNARTIAAQTVEEKLYFGGEAMNLNGHHQTVQGALETGYEQVLSILNSVN